MSIVLEAARVRQTNTHFDKLPPDILESILNLEYRRKYQEVMRMVRLRSFMNDNFDKYERRNENVARAWALGRCFLRGVFWMLGVGVLVVVEVG